MVFFVLLIVLFGKIWSQNCWMYVNQSACPTTGANTCATNNSCLWNQTLGLCLDNGCSHNSNCMVTSSSSCNQAGCFWNAARGFCSWIGTASGYSCGYNSQSTCPTTGSATCATNNICVWNATLGICLDNGCSHNSDCMFNAAQTCNQPGCSFNPILGICSYVGYCEQYTSSTTCPTDNSTTCGTSGKNRCSWSASNSVCYDNGCSQNNPCLSSSNITCSQTFGCVWNPSGFCHYSGGSTPPTCLQSSSTCTACKGSQNLCYLKSPYCYYSNKACINSSTTPTCSAAGACSACLSRYDCTAIQSKCVWDSASRTCSSVGSCSEITTELPCNQSTQICTWASGSCKTCGPLNGCSACRSATDCISKDTKCSWDGSRGICFQNGIVASHLKATLSVQNVTVAINSTVYDSTTSDPDLFVVVSLNGIAHETPRCTNTMACSYTKDNEWSWNDIPINDKGWAKLYDYNESPKPHTLMLESSITTLDWVGRGTLTLYGHNLLNNTRVYFRFNAEGQCADPFFVSNAALTQCTLQECNLRTPINNSCFAGTSDTAMCFIQPAGAPKPCGSTCPAFYTVQADKCVPVACTGRTPVSSQCRSLDDTTAEKINCGYWAETRTCLFCPTSHFQGDSKGVCTLKTCTSRTVNASANYSCGDSNCNEQISGTCAPGCPATHATVDSRGRCVAKACETRTANASAAFTCGEDTCNEQPNGSCAKGCPAAHYTAGDKGKCVLKACASRAVNTSAAYTCGDNSCNEQIEGGCKQNCPAAHYKVGSKGKCELITPCTSRTVNASAAFTCGESACNEQPNGGCAPNCPAAYQPGDKGKCVLKSCSTRSVNPTATYPCGESTCYEQPNGAGCNTTCPSNHYQPGSGNGKCVLKPCASRSKNSSAVSYSCGDANCNEQTDGTCKEGCLPAATYEVGAKGVCVTKECSNRTVTPGAAYTCGDAQCNQQTNGTCAIGCHPAEHYTPGDFGICKLIPKCSERKIVSSESNTCGPNCYELPDRTCGEKCPDKHYQAGAKNVCVLKECKNRQADSTVESTCGESTCNEQPGGGCEKDCPSAHYVVGAKDKCQLIPLCSQRTVNVSADFPCGDITCNEQPEGGCAVGCPAAHYEVDAKGKCILKPACNARKVNLTANYPCGSSDCFQQRIKDGTLGTECNKDCDPALYSANTANGTCVLLDCDKRTADSSLVLPCGSSDCYQQITSDSGGNAQFSNSCNSSCDPLLFSASVIAGTCEILDCDARKSDKSLPFPCGTADCYQQLGGDGNPTGECGSSCNSALFSTDNSTGKCVLLDCSLRKAVTGGLYPCGTPDCFQQIRNNELGIAYDSEFCGSTCDPAFYNVEYIGGTADGGVLTATGKCVLKDCVARTPITTLPFPCGTAGCYLLGNGSCTEYLCSLITVCNKSPGCRTNTDESIKDVCVQDECFQYTDQYTCVKATENGVPCVWIDNRCEISTECKNSQTVNSEGGVECRDGCFLNTANGSTDCAADPCASSHGKDDCIARSNIYGGYVCKWNDVENNCRAEDSCKPEAGEEKCHERCKIDPHGKCIPNVCGEISDETACNTINGGECTYLGGNCVWNDCQIAEPKDAECPRGCAKHTNESIVQCEPDLCVKMHYPSMDCKDSNKCVIEETPTFGTTCVHDPAAAMSTNKSKFPWWVIMVSLLVVAAIAVAAIGALVYVWKKKKGEKASAKIEDVANTEVQMRDEDGNPSENPADDDNSVSATVESDSNSDMGDSVKSFRTGKSKKTKTHGSKKGSKRSSASGSKRSGSKRSSGSGSKRSSASGSKRSSVSKSKRSSGSGSGAGSESGRSARSSGSGKQKLLSEGSRNGDGDSNPGSGRSSTGSNNSSRSTRSNNSGHSTRSKKSKKSKSSKRSRASRK